MVSEHRVNDAREEAPTFLIIDAQSVKNSDPAESKGYDAGKQISGIKRHLAVDSQGLPHILSVTTANISDKAGAKKMLEDRKSDFQKVENVLVDGSYNGQPFADFVEETLGAQVDPGRGCQT